MQDIRHALAAVGAALPRLLLPAPTVEPRRFAVIACDQFTAQPDYWRLVEATVEQAPSALHLMLPEIWLDGRPDAAQAIPATMRRYLEQGIFQEVGETMVYLRRQTTSGIRRGLMLCLDLEQYDFSPGAQSLARATEATVVERLPPRVAVRRQAPLELPHVMVLLDDRDDRLMGLLEGHRRELEKLYEFSLMLEGGQLTGWRVDAPALLTEIADILARLRDEGDGLLYAVGDGNHSLAAAKCCWEELKPTLTPAEREHHPARYSLVELVNLRDPALDFEPIHRLLLGVDPEAVCRELSLDPLNPPDLQQLQPVLDDWLSRHPEARLDYIHGADDCYALSQQAPDRLAIVFPAFEKDALFEVVRRDGAFVRKSFSMGTARDKRYYFEARRIQA